MARLLLVTPTYIAYKVFLRELTRGLQAEGWGVDLACSTTNYPATVEPEPGVEVHEVDFPRGSDPRRYLRAAGQLRRVVHETHPDLVHAHFSSAILATGLAKRRSWPCTLGTYQGLIHPLQGGFRRRLFRVAERWASSRMDAGLMPCGSFFGHPCAV